MHNRKNVISAMIYQVVHTLYGLIIPRLIIFNFGSDINGFVSTITQYLSFISLLEGGLGAVVLAELYKPIENGENAKVRNVLVECQRFFFKLTICFLFYVAGFAVIYSYINQDLFDMKFTMLLTLALSLMTIAQYLFSITSKLYLQAAQKVYIVNNVSSLTLVINIGLSFLVIKVFPDIIVLKLIASILFFFQPLVYRYYIQKEFIVGIYVRGQKNNTVLRNKWSGFIQNLTHFVNINTDIVLISIFSTFSNVSVYSVYLMATNAIRNILVSIVSSYQSAFGKYVAQENIEQLREKFSDFLRMVWGGSIVLFSTCLLLINSFVQLYVNGVYDANYYQPHFGLILVLATFIYCIREPLRFLVMAAGKFRETNTGSVIEAVLNLVISGVLIWPLGLAGVVIGTLIAVTYRFVYFMCFLSKSVINVPIKRYVSDLLKIVALLVINVCLYYVLDLQISTISAFVVYGCLIVGLELGAVCGVFWGVKDTKRFFIALVHRE